MESQLLNLNIKTVFVIPRTTHGTFQLLSSEDKSFVAQAHIVNVIHTVSTYYVIFLYVKRLQIFTQLKIVIGKRVRTIMYTTNLVKFQRWQYWRGFWYFHWLLNKFWFVEEQTTNAADLIWKFYELSKSVNNYISW